MHQIQEKLLHSANLTEQDLHKVLTKISAPNIDIADIFLQYSHREVWGLEEGIVKSGTFSVNNGLSVRIASNTQTSFAYADSISLPALQEAATKARSIITIGNSEKARITTKHISGNNLYPYIDPLQSLSDKEKIALLKKIDLVARDSDPRIKQVMVSLSGSYSMFLVMELSGELAYDIKPSINLNVSVVAEQNGRYEMGNYGCGARMGYEFFYNNDQYLTCAKEAVRIALLNLEATPAPAGLMPVVLGSGWPAVLLHESIGHGLEGDFIRRGSSVFANKLGERVATEACTIVDDGSIPNLRGSINVDDEGTKPERTVLIEKGILTGFMWDRLNAKLTGNKPTGNGRRSSYASIPIPRMTNTFMLNGNYSPAEIIGSVKKGIYAVNFRGGQVDITSGKFVFSASEAYMIENGKIGRPIKGATLIGDGPSILTKVSMVGNDLAFDRGVGTCGKDGQSVAVGVGQPTLKVDGMTVGGTEINQ
jgi:TldD protein